MAIIDKNIIDNVVSRGLGLGLEKNDGDSDLLTITKSIEANVYSDEYYYPTTGCFSKEEIDGWRWNRTLPQEISIVEHGEANEITTHIGGYAYSLKEGIPEDLYRGNVIQGCSLVDVIEEESKWKPALNKGSYSVKGIDKNFYSSNSFCKVLENESTNLSETIDFLQKDTFQIAIYTRDKNFVKKIFREYKEENTIYKYSLNDGAIALDSEKKYFQVGALRSMSVNDANNSLEKVGSLNNGNYVYLKYFPAKDLNLYKVNGSSIELVNSSSYTLDRELGILKCNDDEALGECYAEYKAVPRLDCELLGSGSFVSNIDLKSHKWERGNGLVEISPEDKHVTQLQLSRVDEGDLLYGGEFKSLSCLALNSKDNPVDEIDITIECIDTNQEIFFEGNLVKFKSPSNSDGKVFTSINAPLTSESSSYYFKVNKGDSDSYFQFAIPQEEINQGSFNESVIFEVLSMDPFYGSDGLTFDFEIHDNEKLKISGYQLNKDDYAMFRNLLEISESYSTQNENETNNPFVYNTGLLRSSTTPISVGIVNIENKDGDVYITLEKGFNLSRVNDSDSITVYKKNSKIRSANSNLGVERVLYKLEDESSNIELLRPTSYLNGKLIYANLGNRFSFLEKGNLVQAYRIYVPRKTKIQASCIDPATGRRISSNTLEYELTLSDIYKSELDFETSEITGSRIDTANFISYDPAGNNIYVEHVEE